MTKFNKSKEWLIEEYVIKDRPRAEVAAECGLTVAGLKSLLIKLNVKKEKLVVKEDILKSLIEQGNHVDEIAKKLNCSETSVYRYLKKYNLKVMANPRLVSQYDDTNDSEIVRLYVEEKLSTTKIGEIFGMSHSGIINHLKHCGIQIRPPHEAQFASNKKEYPEEFYNKDFMYDLYINQRKSKKDIGNMFNCDPDVIDRILKNFEIPIRGNGEAHIGLMTGDKHPNWKGGVTPLYRRLREFFKVQQVTKVLARDHYCCQCEGCKSKKNLQVHHIKPFKDIFYRILSEHPDLDPILNVNELYEIAVKDSELCDLNNLITYCQECHLYKIHGYKKQLKADDKPTELLENPNIEDEDNQQPSV